MNWSDSTTISANIAFGVAAALLVVGGLLTVALLGAVVIASVDRRPNREDTP